MDNLRSLSGSLPSSTTLRRHQREQQPPEQLLQAFKTAALSVTNLYRTATSDVSSAYSDGYRDALEDLVGFLDKADLGLNDGEGWRVRQWAAERTANHPAAETSEDEEIADGDDAEKRARSSSPTLQQKSSHEHVSNPTVDAVRTTSPQRPGSAPPVQTQHTTQTHQFTFSAGHSSPGAQMQDIEMSAGNGGGQGPHPSARPARTTRQANSLRMNNQLHNRSALSSSAGAKRKLPFIDFFDISAFGNGHGAGNGRDGPGGGGGGGGTGKRSRLA